MFCIYSIVTYFTRNKEIPKEFHMTKQLMKKQKRPKKQNIPKALREQVWINYIGEKFDSKCYVTWCNNRITCFGFDCGHNIPESKGGQTNIENLRPICRNCNLSMGNSFTIDNWDSAFQTKKWYFFYIF